MSILKKDFTKNQLLFTIIILFLAYPIIIGFLFYCGNNCGESVLDTILSLYKHPGFLLFYPPISFMTWVYIIIIGIAFRKEISKM